MKRPLRAFWPSPLVLLLVGLTACQHARTPRSEVDRRIAYYSARIGGPASYPSQARLGLAYLQKGRETGDGKYHNLALRHLLESLKHQPNFEASLGAALVYLEQHEFAQAKKFAEQAAEALPTSVDAQGVLFDSLLSLGETERASTIVEAMVRNTPGFAALTRQATWRSYRGDFRGAVDSMRRARDHAATLPPGTRAWTEVRLGSLYIATCDASRARASYESALQLHPGYYLALEHLAELEAAEGRTAEAIRIYTGLIARLGQPNHRLAVAELYAATGQHANARKQHEKAIASLRKAVAEGSKAELRELAMELLESPAHAKEGLHLALRDWENRKDATAADTLAWAYFRNGNMAEALTYSQRALDAGSKDAGILLNAALIRLSADRIDEARALLAAARECLLNLLPADRRRADQAWAEVNKRQRQ